MAIFLCSDDQEREREKCFTSFVQLSAAQFGHMPSIVSRAGGLNRLRHDVLQVYIMLYTDPETKMSSLQQVNTKYLQNIKPHRNTLTCPSRVLLQVCPGMRRSGRHHITRLQSRQLIQIYHMRSQAWHCQIAFAIINNVHWLCTEQKQANDTVIYKTNNAGGVADCCSARIHSVDHVATLSLGFFLFSSIN